MRMVYMRSCKQSLFVEQDILICNLPLNLYHDVNTEGPLHPKFYHLGQIQFHGSRRIFFKVVTKSLKMLQITITPILSKICKSKSHVKIYIYFFNYRGGCCF